MEQLDPILHEFLCVSINLKVACLNNEPDIHINFCQNLLTILIKTYLFYPANRQILITNFSLNRYYLEISHTISLLDLICYVFCTPRYVNLQIGKIVSN